MAEMKIQTFRIPNDLKQELKSYSKYKQVGESKVIKTALKKFLDEK